MALAMLIGVTAAQADDPGARRHAAGQYDAATAIYQVVAGDKLEVIALRFGETVEGLMTANDLRSTALQAGQRLVVGEAPMPSPVAKP